MLTIQDVRTVTFPKPGLGRKGYAEDAVDWFIDRVDETLVALTSERDELAEKVSASAVSNSGVTQPIQMVTPQAQSPASHPDVSGVLASAHEVAARVRSEALTQARAMVADAEREAARLVGDARRELELTRAAALAEVDALQTRIGKLREFEASYRAKVEAFMRTQMEGLRTTT